MGWGRKTETQKMLNLFGNMFICVYLFVCPGAPSASPARMCPGWSDVRAGRGDRVVRRAPVPDKW
eukprot:2813043-Pyramimonas_sp.AAC.1